MWTAFNRVVLSVDRDVAEDGFENLVKNANHYWQTNERLL